MATEQQIPKLAAKLTEHQKFFSELSKEDAQWAILNPREAIALFVAAVANRGKEVAKRALSPFNTSNLEAVSKHNTKDCFQDGDGIKYYRDSDLDTWTPQKRKAHDGGNYQAESLTERVNYRKMAAAVLGINLDEEKVNNAELQKRLIEGGHTVEPKQIEVEIERLEAGAEDTAVAKDGNATTFFVDNYDDTVSVVHVYWHRDRGWWDVRIHRFDYDSWWSPVRRVVSRDLKVETT